MQPPRPKPPQAELQAPPKALEAPGACNTLPARPKDVIHCAQNAALQMLSLQCSQNGSLDPVSTRPNFNHAPSLSVFLSLSLSLYRSLALSCSLSVSLCLSLSLSPSLSLPYTYEQQELISLSLQCLAMASPSKPFLSRLHLAIEETCRQSCETLNLRCQRWCS